MESIDKKNNTTKIKKRKHSVFSIIICWVILIVIIVGIVFVGKFIFNSIKYKKYTNKMESYGLNDLYDNKKANANQSVTKSEMIKVIIGSIENVKTVDGLVGESTNYNNEAWVKYAKLYKIIDEDYISESNENSKATFIDSGAIIAKSLEILANKKLYKNGESKYSNLEDFGDLKEYVVRAGENELYNKIKGYLKNDNINKGELNKMIITIVEKYGLIDPSSEYDNDVSIVTDKDKMPKNYEEYPYIINTIENSVYEIDFKVGDKYCVKNPKEIYSQRKEVYAQVYERVKRYFDIILNVDYKTINSEDFYNSLSDLFYYDYDSSIVDEYVNHVKKNKIKIQGTGTPLLPIIYNDGSQIRIRVKVDFTILNTNTNKNILFPDVYGGSNIEYKDATHSFYADIALGQLFDNLSLKIMMEPLLDSIVTEIDTIVRAED